VSEEYVDPRAAHDDAWTKEQKKQRKPRPKRNGHDPAPAETAAADARPPEYSDEALALRFAERYGGHTRYVATWGKWLLWNGSRWEFDDTLCSYNMSRMICRAASAEVGPRNKKLGASIASAKTVAAVASLARADRRLAARVGIWDADPWLLTTPSGIVDLRTGTILPHDAERYMTKITAVGPGGSCPLWRQFLADITGRNVELQAFLQRVAGYSLTGITNEHALFFLFGTGANGKSTLINTLRAILKAYAEVAPMKTFIASRYDQHETDLAGLRGARLVTAQEAEEGRRWDEAKIKTLTGGDPVKARFMRQDFFEYTPAFKLLIAGNHKPSLRTVDEATRRRFHLLPFTITFATPDRELPEKLRAEWPGILQWMIDGCLEWQRIGLAPPEIVRQATEEYLASEDAIALWIDECCLVGRAYAGTRSSDLFISWKAWADKAGEFVGSQKAFSQHLVQRGYRKREQPGTKRWIFDGLALRDSTGDLDLDGVEK
jgi:putative DNA primase/helicase